MSSSPRGSLSSVPNGRIIDFETAELRTLPFQDSLYLWVRGNLPGPGFEARLAPRIYHDRPDYWGIDVAVIHAPEKAGHAASSDIGSADSALVFERSVPLTGITGFRGITVIGASQMKRIEIAGES
jgi:hypothetical protein